jgi:hypothetical protein
MGASLSAEERAALKARAIERLRGQAAGFEQSEKNHRYREQGLSQMTSPQQHEWFNESLRDLQRAGEDIPDWMIKPPTLVKYSPTKRVPRQDWINGSYLHADIKRVLAKVDPQQE